MQQNILLIQSDAQAAQVVRDALKNSFEPQFGITWEQTLSAAFGHLDAASGHSADDPDAYAAILVDLQLSDVGGLEIIDRLVAAAPGIPIIALCSSSEQATAKAAIGRGAQDYLLKEHLSSYLLSKMLAAVIERAAITEALFDEKERAQVTLNSIGDAVICTDIHGHISYLNVVAERLTGWPKQAALGRPVEDVFRIIDAETRALIGNPMQKATQQNATVGLPPTCILIRRDGAESAIEDSSAPIHDRHGVTTGAVMVFHDVTTARALTLKMAYMALHDTLTDLPNRVLLNDRISQAIAAARRHKTTTALLYLDLDRFKQINDSLGHRMGDLLLQSVAVRLVACVRTTDTVSRIGGDEFVILLHEVAHDQDAALCADKVIQAVRAPYLIENHELHVTVSAGIAVHPGDGTEVETLLQNADSAMYEAKRHGRNNFQFYRSDLNSSCGERQMLEIGLRHALERQEFRLYYQPIMNLTTGAVASVEALIRWQHPTLGLILPEQFIPIAEESGLIVPIGQWVLREACRQVKTWQGAGYTQLRLAVNTSAVELRMRNFATGVQDILAQTGLDPCCLELELTETFLMQDSSSTVLVLSAIKALGVHLALDDFGTGYSSLSYMRRFPIDTLKVDRSFVRDLVMDASDASVVSAIIHMGKSLHMRVVAEGVESLAQLQFLRAHGCAEGQGYYFSRPLQGKECADFMQLSCHENAPV